MRELTPDALAVRGVGGVGWRKGVSRVEQLGCETLALRQAVPAGDQTYGVVVVTGTNPSRSRIGRLSSEASTSM